MFYDDYDSCGENVIKMYQKPIKLNNIFTTMEKSIATSITYQN